MPPRSASRVSNNKQTNKTQKKQDDDRPGSGKTFALDIVGLVVDCSVQAVGLVLHHGPGWTENAQVLFSPLPTLVSGVALTPILARMVGILLIPVEFHGVNDLRFKRGRQGPDEYNGFTAAENVHDPCVIYSSKATKNKYSRS